MSLARIETFPACVVPPHLPGFPPE
jgi:hypothetical protein